MVFLSTCKVAFCVLNFCELLLLLRILNFVLFCFVTEKKSDCHQKDTVIVVQNHLKLFFCQFGKNPPSFFQSLILHACFLYLHFFLSINLLPSHFFLFIYQVIFFCLSLFFLSNNLISSHLFNLLFIKLFSLSSFFSLTFYYLLTFFCLSIYSISSVYLLLLSFLSASPSSASRIL